MAVNEYDKGDFARITVTFTVSGVATDPTTVTFKMREPDGVITTWTTVPAVGSIVDDAGAGVFHVDWPVDQTGTHHYRWEGTGAAAAAGEGILIGRPSVF